MKNEPAEKMLHLHRALADLDELVLALQHAHDFYLQVPLDILYNIYSCSRRGHLNAWVGAEKNTCPLAAAIGGTTASLSGSALDSFAITFPNCECERDAGCWMKFWGCLPRKRAGLEQNCEL